MMRLPPRPSTTMCATPDTPGTVRSPVTSMSFSLRSARSSAPKRSSPTAPRKATRAPARAAATAWLAPLPPGTWRKSVPVTVSPPPGTSST